ncbi:nuclear distribution protein PAC1 [Trametes elegans]|nr:nuclear distribution protein PAC1 [Trametes elegans]
MPNDLTDRQQNDLHPAMLDYLDSAGYHNTLELFKQESSHARSTVQCLLTIYQSDYEPNANPKTSGLLIKWTSVIRLQKKVVALESRLAQAPQDNANTVPNPASLNQRSEPDWIPTVSPPKLVLTGHRANVNAVTFHPRYSVLVSASDDSTMRVWDWDTGELERTVQGHTRRVSDCDYDSKGKYLGQLSASHDLFIKLGDVDNVSRTLISTVWFLPGDDRIVSASRDQTVRIWEVATTHCIKVFRPQADWIRAALPSPNGPFVVISCMDHTARVIDSGTGLTKAEFRGHDNVVEMAIFAPRNAVPAIAELAGVKTGTAPTATAEEPSVAFAVTGSRDQKFKIWDARTGQCLHTSIGHHGYLLSAADDGSIRIWALKTGRCMRKLETGERFMSSLAWGRQTSWGGAPMEIKDGQLEAARRVNVIATGCWDYSVKIRKP